MMNETRSEDAAGNELRRVAASLRESLIKRAPAMASSTLAQFDKFLDICHSVEAFSVKAEAFEGRVSTHSLPYSSE